MLRTKLARERLRTGLPLAAAALIAAAIGIASAGGAERRPAEQTAQAAKAARKHTRPLPAPGSQRPNIVFVLTDDLSMNLLPYMPHVQAMAQAGTSFRNYFVSDSLCCPSRSSIFTGRLPHNTGVFSNVGPDGGFHVFHDRGEERQTFAVRLHRAGYRTGFMGKYLNGYMSPQSGGVPDTYVPPGWDDWAVAGDGYPEFDYTLNENGRLRHYGSAAPDYLTDVLADRGVSFIDHATSGDKPFFLELATFAPHSPYTPAPRYADALPGVGAPRLANYDRLPTHAPHWLADHPPLDNAQKAQIDAVFRRRAQAVMAIDDLLARIQVALRDDGVARDTYVIFSSDNGFHAGQYRLMPGKLTAYDSDIRVPLVVTGPGVPAGASVPQLAENIDLAPTFAALGGVPMPADGRSLVPLLQGRSPAGWRRAALVEHHGPRWRVTDPDRQHAPSGNPTTYEAMRTARALYVEYRDGEREYYDLVRDPFELDNVYRSLPAARRARLHRTLARMQSCRGPGACWQAMSAAGA